jgi:stage II sporulation protein GA (sporulation sigma-E factor processing peptidase)
MLILLSCLIYFLLFLIKKVFKNHTNSFLIHNVRFKYKDKEYTVKCKTDSGLNLKEPFSGDNVIVIESSEVYIADRSSMRVIPFHSLGGNGIIYGFKAEFVFIDAKRINEEIYIGLCEGIFKNEIKGLIPEFFTED